MLMWSILSRILAVVRIRWSHMLWLAISLALLHLISGMCGSLSDSRLLVLMILYLVSPNSIIQLIPYLGKKTYLLSNGQPHKPTPHAIFCLLPYLDQPYLHLRGCQPLLWWRIQMTSRRGHNCLPLPWVWLWTQAWSNRQSHQSSHNHWSNHHLLKFFNRESHLLDHHQGCHSHLHPVLSPMWWVLIRKCMKLH